jgi:hypothetical protein
MGPSLAVLRFQTITPKCASRLYKDPSMFNKIAADNYATLDDLEMPRAEYVGFYYGRALAAILVLTAYKDGYLGHAQILPEYRMKFIGFGKAYFEAKTFRIYAVVPNKYRSYQKICKRLGFTKVSDLPRMYLKGGVVYDGEELVHG